MMFTGNIPVAKVEESTECTLCTANVCWDVEIMPYIYTQLYYQLIFLWEWVLKQGGSKPVRVCHEQEGACSVHLAEEELT